MPPSARSCARALPSPRPCRPPYRCWPPVVPAFFYLHAAITRQNRFTGVPTVEDQYMSCQPMYTPSALLDVSSAYLSCAVQCASVADV